MKLITLILLLATWLIQAALTFNDTFNGNFNGNFNVTFKETFKQIPNLVALGYTVQGSTPISGDFVHYDVSWGATFLTDLAVYKDNKHPGVLAVFNAQTDDDTRPEALPLRDIQLGVWAYSIGRDAADLLYIKYLDVVEPELVEVTPHVYELMGVPQSQDLMIFRNYHSENEGKAYDILHNETPFGSGAQKMTDEFAEMQDKEVEAFWYEAQAPGVFHFTIYFFI
ncbi:hypothetical protein INS49_012461 [Diaporthe citri]|uniref:uncharacterized protein n=1 Tax=Diaporthe citri TaxID=83186 RepID=UPI001C810616|nr:uncharacterized protein INS49_012461 [Diaporthe citri]KAG6358941.1 hypothetical protein INS49_012461 [Diaporthe citri]